MNIKSQGCDSGDDWFVLSVGQRTINNNHILLALEICEREFVVDSCDDLSLNSQELYVGQVHIFIESVYPPVDHSFHRLEDSEVIDRRRSALAETTRHRHTSLHILLFARLNPQYTYQQYYSHSILFIIIII